MHFASSLKERNVPGNFGVPHTRRVDDRWRVLSTGHQIALAQKRSLMGLWVVTIFIEIACVAKMYSKSAEMRIK